MRAAGQRDDLHQHQRPDTEHDFDFSQQMPQARMMDAALRKMLKTFRAKSMQYRQRKQRGPRVFDQAGVVHGSVGRRTNSRRLARMKSKRAAGRRMRARKYPGIYRVAA